MGLPASSFHDQSCKDSTTVLSEKYHRKNKRGWGISFPRKNSSVCPQSRTEVREQDFLQNSCKSVKNILQLLVLYDDSPFIDCTQSQNVGPSCALFCDYNVNISISLNMSSRDKGSCGFVSL